MAAEQPQRRSTRQREAIRDAIDSAGRPLTCDEILERAAESVPTLSLATVYRTLKMLLDEDEIALVEVPGEIARYERAGLDHHHHFHCERCDRVIDVVGCPLDVDDFAPPGFTVTRHEITLFGRCDRCAGA